MQLTGKVECLQIRSLMNCWRECNRQQPQSSQSNSLVILVLPGLGFIHWATVIFFFANSFPENASRSLTKYFLYFIPGFLLKKNMIKEDNYHKSKSP